MMNTERRQFWEDVFSALFVHAGYTLIFYYLIVANLSNHLWKAIAVASVFEVLSLIVFMEWGKHRRFSADIMRQLRELCEGPGSFLLFGSMVIACCVKYGGTTGALVGAAIQTCLAISAYLLVRALFVTTEKYAPDVPVEDVCLSVTTEHKFQFDLAVQRLGDTFRILIIRCPNYEYHGRRRFGEESHRLPGPFEGYVCYEPPPKATVDDVVEAATAFAHLSDRFLMTGKSW